MAGDVALGAFEDFDAAHQLLLACSLASSRIDLSGAVPRLAGLVSNWNEFLASVETHQLRPIVASRLSRDASGVFPAPVLDRLAEAAQALAGRALFMGAELVRILDALRAAGIDAVALKGPAFAEFSGEGVAARELTDLDVLIRPRDIGR